MSNRPSFFAALPGEPGPRDSHGEKRTQPVVRRHAVHDDYRRALEGVKENFARFDMYNESQALRAWASNAKRARTQLDEALRALEQQVLEFDAAACPACSEAGGPTAAATDRRPDETLDAYEYRLFRDFAIRLFSDSGKAVAYTDGGPPVFLVSDPSVELLTNIRDLLEQLVGAVTPAPTINFGKIETLFGEDPAKLWERLIGTRGFSVPDDAPAHETSPSVDGCGDPTEGERPVAEAQEDASATAGTETPVGIDTSPLVVHKTAALQDAISARDAVFFRLRNLATQPITEYSHEQLARMGEEMGIKQAHVHRCTEQLEKARAAEVARGGPDDGPGKFSNRRRPGTRFSNPTPPSAPETPDAAQ